MEAGSSVKSSFGQSSIEDSDESKMSSNFSVSEPDTPCSVDLKNMLCVTAKSLTSLISCRTEDEIKNESSLGTQNISVTDPANVSSESVRSLAGKPLSEDPMKIVSLDVETTQRKTVLDKDELLAREVSTVTEQGDGHFELDERAEEKYGKINGKDFIAICTNIDQSGENGNNGKNGRNNVTTYTTHYQQNLINRILRKNAQYDNLHRNTDLTQTSRNNGQIIHDNVRLNVDTNQHRTNLNYLQNGTNDVRSHINTNKYGRDVHYRQNHNELRIGVDGQAEEKYGRINGKDYIAICTNIDQSEGNGNNGKNGQNNVTTYMTHYQQNQINRILRENAQYVNSHPNTNLTQTSLNNGQNLHGNVRSYIDTNQYRTNINYLQNGQNDVRPYVDTNQYRTNPNYLQNGQNDVRPFVDTNQYRTNPNNLHDNVRPFVDTNQYRTNLNNLHDNVRPFVDTNQYRTNLNYLQNGQNVRPYIDTNLTQTSRNNGQNLHGNVRPYVDTNQYRTNPNYLQNGQNDVRPYIDTNQSSTNLNYLQNGQYDVRPYVDTNQYRTNLNYLQNDVRSYIDANQNRIIQNSLQNERDRATSYINNYNNQREIYHNNVVHIGPLINNRIIDGGSNQWYDQRNYVYERNNVPVQTGGYYILEENSTQIYQPYANHQMFEKDTPLNEDRKWRDAYNNKEGSWKLYGNHPGPQTDYRTGF